MSYLLLQGYSKFIEDKDVSNTDYQKLVNAK